MNGQIDKLEPGEDRVIINSQLLFVFRFVRQLARHLVNTINIKVTRQNGTNSLLWTNLTQFRSRFETILQHFDFSMTKVGEI